MLGAAGPPMRVLVLTAPVREVHVAAARTLSEDIRRQHADAEVVFLRRAPGPAAAGSLVPARRVPLAGGCALALRVLHRSGVARSVRRATLSLAAVRGRLTAFMWTPCYWATPTPRQRFVRRGWGG